MTENGRNTMNEQEIDLVDLMMDILLHWRMIIVLMLVGGILMGGVSYLRSASAISKQQEMAGMEEGELSDEEREQEIMDLFSEAYGENALDGDMEISDVDEEWLRDQLTETEAYNVDQAILYDRLIEQRMEYKENELAMQVDPYHVPREELTFLIRSDSIERSSNIEKVYEDLLTGSGLFEYLMDACGVGENVSEMVSIEASGYSAFGGCDSVRVKVTQVSAKECKKLADALLSYINDKSGELQSTLGEHELVLLDRSASESFVSSYLDTQRTFELDVANYQSTAMGFKGQFNDKQWIYYNYLTDGEIAGNPDAELAEAGEAGVAAGSENASPSVSIKYVILGMVLFAFVYVFILFMRYVLNNRLRATDSLQDLYNVPQLGMVPAKEAKRKPLDFVDRWLVSLRDRNKRSFSEEEALRHAIVAVKMSAEHGGVGSAYLVGCNLKGHAMEVCEKVRSALAAEGIKAEILSNVLYDAQAMESLEGAKSVVLVETAGSTLYQEICQEVILMDRQEIPVLGGIVVAQ